MNIENYIEKDYNHVLNDLQDYILNKENIEQITFFKRELVNKDNIKKDVNKQQNDNNKTNNPTDQKKYTSTKFFYPKEKDSLFWCFYIMKHGLLNYQMINNRNIVFEKKHKIDYIEKIRKEKHIIKNYKFASLCNIENNLVNDMKIDSFSFLTLCVIENINVIFIKNKTYYELQMNDSNDIYVIKINEKGQYGFETIQKIGNDVYETYKNNFYKIENIDKPVKSITYYKVSDLTDICVKLSVETKNKETGKQKNKKELYESIIQHL
jgi:hypothetical protein